MGMCFSLCSPLITKEIAESIPDAIEDVSPAISSLDTGSLSPVSLRTISSDSSFSTIAPLTADELDRLLYGNTEWYDRQLKKRKEEKWPRISVMILCECCHSAKVWNDIRIWTMKSQQECHSTIWPQQLWPYRRSFEERICISNAYRNGHGCQVFFHLLHTTCLHFTFFKHSVTFDTPTQKGTSVTVASTKAHSLPFLSV